MKKIWHDIAWDRYVAMQSIDKRMLRKVNKLLKDIERNGYKCIGKPEPLKHHMAGWWSVQIDQVNRLVFRLEGEMLEIAQCGGHYEEMFS